MKYAANIDGSNVVRQVIALPDANGLEWCDQELDGVWVYTRAPGDPDSKCADIGDTYDPSKGTFSSPVNAPGDARADLADAQDAVGGADAPLDP